MTQSKIEGEDCVRGVAEMSGDTLWSKERGGGIVVIGLFVATVKVATRPAVTSYLDISCMAQDTVYLVLESC